MCISLWCKGWVARPWCVFAALWRVVLCVMLAMLVLLRLSVATVVYVARENQILISALFKAHVTKVSF